MKIQNLAIIFIIIILPISLVFASYTKNRVETINLQSNYDSKLNDATHDAIKAYQLNSFSNVSGALTNSKIRDIKASVNTFFNSLSTNFSTLGYTKTTLQNYVPALVYTMYDGYYIYSPLTNTLNTKNNDGTDRNDDIANEMREQIGNAQEEEYQDLQTIYDLKPYVYYSCQYKTSDIDVVITYSLDNYIQIQGTINNGQLVSKQGYLLDNVEIIDNNTVKYNGITIMKEEQLLKEHVFTIGDNGGELTSDPLPYTKINGSKYYKEENGNVFTLLNDGKKLQQIGKDLNYDDNAFNYYKEAAELKKFIEDSGLIDLKIENIVNADTNNPYYAIDGKIFDFDNPNNPKGIESETSNFNTHRIDVIKHSIEKNLSIAIANFNNYSGVATDFQMPRLKDSDWDKIMSNISLISFFQGANIGGKVYNGYSIVTNTKNEDVVMEDSIYIKNGDTIYNIADKKLKNADLSSAVGIFNINTEPRAGIDGATYYMPVTGTLSYGSIITKDDIDESFDGDVREYVRTSGNDILKKIYYTALGRERYGLYRLRLEIN